MKLIKLTQGKFAKVDDSDFKDLNEYSWSAIRVKNNFYAVTAIKFSGKYKNVLMHRMILCLTKSKKQCDHHDRNGLNNQKSNLRISTHSQNQRNRNSHRDSTSRYLGVSLNKTSKKWVATIQSNKKFFYLGSFKLEKEAAICYNMAAIKHHKQFANLNKI